VLRAMRGRPEGPLESGLDLMCKRPQLMWKIWKNKKEQLNILIQKQHTTVNLHPNGNAI
jgi:hypothetical protein